MMYSDTSNTGNKEVETETISEFIYKDETGTIQNPFEKYDASSIQDLFGEYLKCNQTRLDDIRTQTDKIGEAIDKMIEYRDHEINDLICQKQNLLVEIQDLASIMNENAMKLKYATAEWQAAVCARQREYGNRYNAEEWAKLIKPTPLIIYAFMFVLGIALSIVNEWGRSDQLMYFGIIGVCVVFVSVVLYTINLNKITKSQKNFDELRETEKYKYEEKDKLEKKVSNTKETIESLCREIQIIDEKIFELWTEFAGHKEEDDENV